MQGDAAHPPASVCRQRARIGRGIKALNPGGAGAKPPKPAPIPKLPSETERPLIMRDSGLLAPIDIELPHNGTSSETICRNAYRARAKMTAIHRNRAQPAPGSERQRHL